MRKPQVLRELREREKIGRFAEQLAASEDEYPISDEELLEIRQRVDDFEQQMRLRRSRTRAKSDDNQRQGSLS